jgi:inhibitor of KinA
MNTVDPQFKPLGDNALLMEWGNLIDRSINKLVVAMAGNLDKQPFYGLVDMVPAYSSLTVIYDPVAIKSFHGNQVAVFEFIQQYLLLLINKQAAISQNDKAVIEIPVCYELKFSDDLEKMQVALNLSLEDIIARHSNQEYYVYMQGFLPGFAYMGEVDERIAISRKNKPVPVIAGAVGIAGRQTGIYPVDSPGGWYIVGYTPLKMFDARDTLPCRLMAGDAVVFKPINLAAYNTIKQNQGTWE